MAQRALTDKEVVWIRRAKAREGATDQELAERYGVSASLINQVLNGRAYADVEGGPTRSFAYARKRRDLTKAHLKAIKEAWSRGESKHRIISRLNVDSRLLYQLKQGGEL